MAIGSSTDLDSAQAADLLQLRPGARRPAGGGCGCPARRRSSSAWAC